MSELRINNITDRAGSSGPIIAGVSTVTSTSHMVMPSGPTEMRGGRGRAVIGGGNTPSDVNTLDRIEIGTTGNAVDFGDLSAVREQPYGASSATRGLFAGGKTDSNIDHVTISSGGGGNDFGSLSGTAHSGKGVSDGITAVYLGGKWGGAYTGTIQIEYNIIASLGNSSSFGDIASGRVFSQTGGFASPTRGVVGAGGARNSPNYQKAIEFLTIATKGSTQDFGEISFERSASGGCASATRGIFVGGQVPAPTSGVNVIDYITIATEGNETHFGEITTRRRLMDSSSSLTRGVCIAGYQDTSPAALVNTIDYVTIATTGDATDFGDLTTVRRFTATCSDVHGGLG